MEYYKSVFQKWFSNEGNILGHNQTLARAAFAEGAKAALWLYAINRNGNQFVGSGNMTLQEARQNVDEQLGIKQLEETSKFMQEIQIERE